MPEINLVNEPIFAGQEAQMALTDDRIEAIGVHADECVMTFEEEAWFHSGHVTQLPYPKEIAEMAAELLKARRVTGRIEELADIFHDSAQHLNPRHAESRGGRQAFSSAASLLRSALRLETAAPSGTSLTTHESEATE